MIGVPAVKDEIREYVDREHGGTPTFERVEIEGEFAFAGAWIETGLLGSLTAKMYVFTIHHPSGTIVAEENLSEWGLSEDPKLLMNDKIDEWIHMSEQQLRNNFGV